MKAIYALYGTPESANRAFHSLRRRGVPESEITVISAEPLEEHDWGTAHRNSRLSWIAAAGGGAGLATGYFLTSLTQQAWPIETGGMPIVANWTNLIVIFELTMLGAVLAAVAAFLFSARLPARLPAIYDPEVSASKILVGVANPAASKVEAIEQALAAEAAVELRRLP